jgi:nicotinate dehydrogenase subunit B
VLRFSESPAVEVSIIDRPEESSPGVGEAIAGPVAAAIANAVFNAIGVRVRDLPLTRERMLAAINDA